MKFWKVARNINSQINQRDGCERESDRGHERRKVFTSCFSSEHFFKLFELVLAVM